ncbi:AhpD family alkylhydroperoxidase [Bradyrhizobium diazoefficiens]
MQHEGEPLGRLQCFQHDQECRADGIGHLRFALPRLVDRLRYMRAHRVLPARLSCAQHVEANARDHGGQPAPQIRDIGRIAPAEPQPGLLHGIVDLAAGTQHPVGDRAQMIPVGLELLAEKIFFRVFLGHRSHSWISIRHAHDEANSANVTGTFENRQMETTIMHARMNHPVMVLPEAMNVLQSLGNLTKQGLPEKLLELVHLRASQINGCSVCVDMHPKIARKAGETDERLFAVSAWRDAPYFSEAERAALALTEAVTRLADREDPVSDTIWNEAAKHFDERELATLILSIATINVWNRLNATIKMPVGVWKV